MKPMLLTLLLLALAAPAAAQPASGAAAPQAASPAPPPPLARHVVMFTRAGPNFAKIADHREEALAHQALYERLAEEGHTVAGGAFEGTPVLGMTVFSEGIDEARARELIAADQLPGLGIVAYEFRTLGVRMGSFRADR